MGLQNLLHKNITITTISKIFICVIILISVLYLLDIFKKGERSVGTVENLYGVPYYRANGDIYVQEELAHMDVYLQEPVFAKQLNLTIKFTPRNCTRLAVGVRKDSFWLSYDKIPLLTNNDVHTIKTSTVSIPLTDKFQEIDRSIDIMFFAEYEQDMNDMQPETVDWVLHNVDLSVQPVPVSIVQAKDYIGSIIKRERAE